MTTSTEDVVIIGAGVMGCTIALNLVQRGIPCRLLERSVPGAEASTVAAGILAPLIEVQEPGPALTLGTESRELYAKMAATLHDEHGLDIGFRRSGLLALAFDEEDVVTLSARREFVLGVGHESSWLDARELGVLEPRLHPELLGALRLPQEAQVEPARLLPAISTVALRLGARIQTGATVDEIVVEGDRVHGVRLADGTLIGCSTVVLAAGSWTRFVGGAGKAPAAVQPVRGQVLHTSTRPPVARHILYGAGGYLVPRPDGRLVIGATMESAGFDKRVTLAGVSSLVERAMRIAPELAHAELEDVRVNFRPATPDGLPSIGQTHAEGLIVATGHHRNGVLWAPVTAEIVADLVERKPSRVELGALSPDRFHQRGRT